jgi:hypothetical protein
MVGKCALDRRIWDESGRSVGLEMIDPADAGFRRSVRGIAAGGGTA